MKYFFLLILFFLLSACSEEPQIKNAHLLAVESKPLVNTLFYSGTIQPLNTSIITSPADGVLIDMHVQYGEPVQKGQLLFTLSSEKFLSEYKTSLLNYLKAKSDFDNSKIQLEESTLLHKNELISDNDFKSKQTNYYASQLALLQAKDALDIFIKQLNIKDNAIYQLSITDIDKIDKIMRFQISSQHLRIFSSANGIVLSPAKSEVESKKLVKGDMVKQGDVLAIIGDLNGVSVNIKVNELMVNQLRIGQEVKVTGIAFQNDRLQGAIHRIDKQAEIVNGSLPMFAVEIVVPKLNEKQKKLIHVGMSAKLEIAVNEEQQMMVPLKALIEINGEPHIKLLDSKTKKLFAIPVKTGKTTLDAVAIVSGLKLGDQIVIPD